MCHVNYSVLVSELHVLHFALDLMCVAVPHIIHLRRGALFLGSLYVLLLVCYLWQKKERKEVLARRSGSGNNVMPKTVVESICLQLGLSSVDKLSTSGGGIAYVKQQAPAAVI